MLCPIATTVSTINPNSNKHASKLVFTREVVCNRSDGQRSSRHDVLTYRTLLRSHLERETCWQTATCGATSVSVPLTSLELYTNPVADLSSVFLKVFNVQAVSQEIRNTMAMQGRPTHAASNAEEEEHSFGGFGLEATITRLSRLAMNDLYHVSRTQFAQTPNLGHGMVVV
jgi:hypothetical protein